MLRPAGPQAGPGAGGEVLLSVTTFCFSAEGKRHEQKRLALRADLLDPRSPSPPPPRGGAAGTARGALRAPERRLGGGSRAEPRDIRAGRQKACLCGAVSSPGLDISALEIFWPLCFGFRLCLASAATARSGPALAELLARVRPRYFQATPTTFRSLLHAGWRGGPRTAAISGGEALPGGLAQQLSALCGGGVWNAYGPTETTIWSSTHRLPAPCLQGAPSPLPAVVPIGGPISGTTLLIAPPRPADGEEAPPPASAAHGGACGELLIGGVGVARGYRNRPELTAARFVPRPGRAGEPAGVYYHTGDLVRLPADGLELAFLGRLDHQVKIRGFRVELGEVESLLEQSPGVRAAVVSVLGGPGEAGGARSGEEPALAAHVLVGPGAGRAPEWRRALLSQLAARLPSYMVPRHIVALESFPLLPSGKVDRTALLEVQPDAWSTEGGEGVEEPCDGATIELCRRLSSLDWAGSSAQGEAAASSLRHAVAAIASAVTGAAPPADDEDVEMASLGIDSVSAVPMADALSRLLLSGRAVPLEDLYVHATLPALAAYLRGRLLERPAPARGAPDVCAAMLGPERAPARLGGAARRRRPGQASRDGDLRSLAALLEARAFDPAAARDRFGGSALHWAASGGHLGACRLLVEGRAEPGFADKKSGRCALHWCARQGHLRVAQWLVGEHSQCVGALTKDRTTPLQLAAWGGHVPVCAWLLGRGASLEHRNAWQCLPHHFAALAGMTATCAWLHDHSADLRATNDQGHGALHKAAYGGHRALCAWLQDELGIDRRAAEPDARGQTPADLALKVRYRLHGSRSPHAPTSISIPSHPTAPSHRPSWGCSCHSRLEGSSL
ncbi:unnamed protein product [Prorocentrum cordatum]|uniref:Carrier domain-containing protein n=1 Tax=Prorocentrum cordatum TaxID=2364126 RepID=A0ABN9UP87_9DINO|nr:unnamed protein product [Polarella glacialis]